MGDPTSSPAGPKRRAAGAALLAGVLLAGGLGSGSAVATAAVRAAVPAGTLSTVAGGVGGPGRGTAVAVGKPCGVDYAGGRLYFSDEAVRAVSEGSGWLTTAAGDTMFVTGPYGEGGPATGANVWSCGTPAVDQAGNLLVPATSNRRVRVVAARSGTFYGQAMTAGHIYTIAGDGNLGLPSQGGVATAESLRLPRSVAVDPAGNVIVSDYGDGAPSQLLVVAVKTGTFYGRAMTAGHLYVVAGKDSLTVSGDGGPAITAGLGSGIGQAELDGAGNIVLADGSANSIRVVAEKSGTFYGQTMTAGDIYRVAGNGTAGYSGNGGPATAAELFTPTGVAVDGAGNLVLADTRNGRIRVVAAHTGSYYGLSMKTGDIYSVAGGGTGGIGDGGPAGQARFRSPTGVAIDGAGNILVADSNDHRVRVVAAHTGSYYGVTMKAGNIYTAAGDGLLDFSGDGGPAARAEMTWASGLGVTATGGMAVADNDDNRIRFVAAKSGTFYGVNMKAGDIYTVAGDGQFGYAGDDGPATKASLNYPDRAAVDGAGNLLIADTGNSRIRVVAAHTGSYYGMKMTAGDIYTVAGNGNDAFSGDGGPALKAALNLPWGVAVDGAGNILIADSANNRVRVVAAKSGTFYGRPMTSGDIYTVAGSGPPGSQNGEYAGDGGPAAKARMNWPVGVAVDSAGDLLISDSYNARVRVVAARTGSYYGVTMTTGDIYTVAGDGTAGFSGGGSATRQELDGPGGLAVGSAGNVLIADINWVQSVSG